MAKATIKDYGTVEFDPTNYDNNVYDLYVVAIIDPERDYIKEEEHYLSENEFNDALENTYGREVMERQLDYGWTEVWYEGESYDCEYTMHVAYVIDHDE